MFIDRIAEIKVGKGHEDCWSLKVDGNHPKDLSDNE